MSHKHYKVICEWALDPDKVVQCRSNSNEPWEDIRIGVPTWCRDMFYRIKPEKVEDIVTEAKILGAYKSVMWNSVTDQVSHANIRLTFDGKTGKLKAAEVLS